MSWHRLGILAKQKRIINQYLEGFMLYYLFLVVSDFMHRRIQAQEEWMVVMSSTMWKLMKNKEECYSKSTLDNCLRVIASYVYILLFLLQLAAP